MKEFLYAIVGWIARVHNTIMTWNDAYEQSFTDKELHFIVIGLLGIAMVLVIYPFFKALAKNHVLVIAWIYVFTLVLVVTFAIEIGQGITRTGVMDFEDVEYGVLGFLFMFFVFAIVRAIYHGLQRLTRYLVHRIRGGEEDEEDEDEDEEWEDY